MEIGERKCFVCGTTKNLHRHHVYGGSNRKISDKEGFVVDLCFEHHNGSDKGVHFNPKLDLHIKQVFQKEYEKNHTRDEFIKLIGRNYL